MKISLTIWILLLPSIGFSQQLIKGKIEDLDTHQSIPFASIGISGSQLGTLSDGSGNFELIVPDNYDSIKITAIGYDALYVRTLSNYNQTTFYLNSKAYELSEVKVKPKNIGYLLLGSSKYSKDICTAFMGIDNNWIGAQAAIRANNKEGQTVFMESFSFYIIKNEYEDSLQFRIMFYEVDLKGNPGKTFLQEPILFKTNCKQGEVTIDLKKYRISTTGDFFISIECLEKKIESSKFCFAGSIKVPSFFKNSAFSRWGNIKGGGGDFNVKVSYAK